MEEANTWFQKYYECPYCKENHQTEKESGDVETCVSCGENFELGEFEL